MITNKTLKAMDEQCRNRIAAIAAQYGGCAGYEIVPILDGKYAVNHNGITLAICSDRESAVITRDDFIRRTAARIEERRK